MKESSGANRHIHYLTDSVKKKLNIPGRQFIYYNCLFCHAPKMSSFGHDPLFFIICLNNTKFFLESIMFLIIIRNLSLSKGYSRVPYLNDIGTVLLSLNIKTKEPSPCLPNSLPSTNISLFSGLIYIYRILLRHLFRFSRHLSSL